MSLLLVFLAGILVLFQAISRLEIRDSKYIDVWHRESSNKDTLRTLTLDASRLQRSRKPKLIIIGGSSSGLGFRPEHLQQLFPDYEIANLAVPGANAMEVRQVMEMVQTLLPQDVLQESVFVCGIVYHTLTAVSIEPKGCINPYLVESGLYKWSGDGVRPIIWASKMDFLVQILRPYFSLQHALQRRGFGVNGSYAEEFVSRLFRKLRGEPAITRREEIMCDYLAECRFPTDEEKQFYVNWIGSRCDLESDAGFDEMLLMCQSAQNKGGMLVLVDVPIAEWHKQLSPAHKSYQRRKFPYIDKALELSNVRYINLLDVRGLSDETRFRDGVHPCEEAAESWSLALRERWPYDS